MDEASYRTGRAGIGGYARRRQDGLRRAPSGHGLLFAALWRRWWLTRFGGAAWRSIHRTNESCAKNCAKRMAWRRWRRSRCRNCSQALREHSHIIIDGLYSFSEYKLLDESLGAPLVLVAIAAPRQLRYQRLAARSERPLTPSEARERDLLEIERLEKGGPIALADFTLLNEGAPADLLRKLDGLLDTLGFSP